MDLEYFKDKICEELDGAKEYVKNALEIKAMVPAWGKMFIDMANAEIQHATYLYKMADEYCSTTAKAYTEMPQYMLDLKEEIVDEYMEKSALVKHMIEMYNK